MTSRLVEAINKNTMTFTENGDLTHATSANDFVDLFFKIGASRGRAQSLLPLLTKCSAQDFGLSMRLLFWARDVRGGAGERDMFRTLVRELLSRKEMTEDYAKRIAVKTVEVGRWDDLLAIFYGTNYVDIAFSMIEKALLDGDALCAKWMPREKSSRAAQAAALCKYMGITARKYRKLVVSLTNVVETQMCNREWTGIEFNKVPSQAVNNYRKAFARNAPVQWESFLEAVKKGDVKINAGAIYPYQLLSRNIGGRYGWSMDASQLAQWDALPDYTEGKEASILPVVDVSGSMDCSAGADTSVTCMQVALSLGLYLSQKLKGPFQDSFMTFTDTPTLQTLKGSMNDRLSQMSGAVGYSTNVDGVFKALLSAAKKHNVPESDMPTMIVMFSDMQFNCGSVGGFTAHERFKKMYHEAGYNMPQLVYWNINARNGSPVTYDTYGTALVSGFSPSLVKSILSVEDMSPVSMMMKTLMDKRYNW